MFDSNDPRLTAYVLGELDAAARAELEAEIQSSPELRRTVEELRQAAEFLREALTHEPTPALTVEQREAIRAASRRAAQPREATPAAGNGSKAASHPPAEVALPPPSAAFPRGWVLSLASLAALVLVGVVAVSNRPQLGPEEGIALHRAELAKNRPGEPAEASPRALYEDRFLYKKDAFDESAPSSDAAPALSDASDFSVDDSRLREFGTATREFVEGERRAWPESAPRRALGGAPPPATATAGRGAAGGGGYGGIGGGAAPYGGLGGEYASGSADASYGAIPDGYQLEEQAAGRVDRLPRDTRAENRYSDMARAGGDAAERGASRPSPPAQAPGVAGPAPRSELPQLHDAPFNPRESNASQAFNLPLPSKAPTSASAPSAPPVVQGRTETLSDLEAAKPQGVPATPAPADASPSALGLAVPEGLERAPIRAAREPETKAASSTGAEEVDALAANNRPASRSERNAPSDMAVRQRLAAASGEPGVVQLQQADAERTKELAENEDLDEKKGQDGAEQAGPERENKEKQTVRKDLRTWRRVNAVPNASRLMVGERDELALQGMQANVTIDGFRARVILDLYFYNDRDRQLEGDFRLRLPNEASLYYFAFGESSFEYRPQVDQLASRDFLAPELIRASGTGPEEIVRVRGDAWTKVKEARIVPREKAAHAYSETVRRRVDPALVEWAGAGVFNARVFPLMPGKLHRIVVGYDVNLTPEGDALTYRLDLPEDASQVHVDLNLAAVPGGEAEVTPSARPFLASGRAYYHLEGPWSEPLAVRINHPGTLVLHGKDGQGDAYFATRVTPDLPADANSAASPHAIFLVDTSLSANPDKFNIWLKLLETTLTKNRDTLKQFAVLFFNVESHWWREKYVENNPENVRELLNYCNTLALEGATDLRQALAEATAPAWAGEAKPASQPDLFLLSDGAVTWGEQNVHLLAQTLRSGTGGSLFAYQTGLAGTAVGVLEHLARESGGAVFSVAHEQEIDAAATAHRQRPWRLVDVAIPGGSDLLIAGRPKTVYPGQSLLVVGRGQPGNQVVLRVARGEEETTVAIPLSQAVASESAARLYGQTAVGQLEDLGPAVEDVSVAYARHFRVAGQTCSLLMLESEADYQRFNIRPEDDAFVVKSSAAASVVANKLDELGDQLTDPKKSFALWLAKMERMPGVQFRLSTAMKLAFERLPAEALTVLPPRLAVNNRSRDELSKKYFQQLEAARLDYDAVSEEAARRFAAHGPADALKALSSLIENSPGDPVLARDVAFSAIEWGLGGQAYWLLRRVADARPYEPQVYQALGQCAAELGNADLAILYYEVALGGQWHERYQDFHRVAGFEYLHLLRRIDRGELASHIPDFAKARREAFIAQGDVDRADLVVTMMWNTDRTDVDLHVLEPSGEECFYKNRTTRAGGEITRDVTEGYGPEMYVMKNAPHGKYVVKANYYGSDANRTELRTKVYVTVYEDFGGRRERVTKKTVALSRGQELREVAEVFVEKQ